MAPYYRTLCAKDSAHFKLDEQLEQELQSKNDAVLAAINTTQEAAEVDSGGVPML